MNKFYTYLINSYDKSDGSFLYTHLNSVLFKTVDDSSLADDGCIQLRDGSWYRDLDDDFEIYELKELWLWEGGY